MEASRERALLPDQVELLAVLVTSKETYDAERPFEFSFRGILVRPKCRLGRCDAPVCAISALVFNNAPCFAAV